MPEHFEMWVGYDMFFLVVTVCQVLLRLILLGFSPISSINILKSPNLTPDSKGES